MPRDTLQGVERSKPDGILGVVPVQVDGCSTARMRTRKRVPISAGLLWSALTILTAWPTITGASGPSPRKSRQGSLRRTLVEVDGGPQADVTSETEALEWDGSCSPLNVTGLDHCQSWQGTNVMSKLLRAKKEMLRGIVRALDEAAEDPQYVPDRPLLLVQELAVDEADAAVGAALPVYQGNVQDAVNWNVEIGGMNRWLKRYYEEVLGKSRPVLVTVHVSSMRS